MTSITLKQRVREIWQKLLDARPYQIATGFSIEIFASFLPLNPSPLIVATVVAWLLKRNVLAAAVGALASILYLPLLLSSGYVYSAMLIGSIIIAVPVTILTYFIFERLAERWARQKNKLQRSA